MDPIKLLIATAAIFVFIGIFVVFGRVIFLLATRKVIDVASVEMKIYMLLFIVLTFGMLVISVASGVVPARWGVFKFNSNPFWFVLRQFYIVVFLSFCMYVFVKSLRKDSWIVRIRK